MIKSKILALVSLSIISTVAANAESMVATEAMQLFERGRFEEARRLFGTLVQEEPNNFRATYYLALTYRKLGKDETAKAYFQSIVKRFPNSTEGQYSSVQIAQILSQLSQTTSVPVVAGAAKTSKSADVSSFDDDYAAALNSAATIRAKGETDALAYESKAHEIETQMLAVPAGGRRASGSAFNKNEIDSATADLHRLASEARESSIELADDLIYKASVRHNTQAQNANNLRAR